MKTKTTTGNEKAAAKKPQTEAPKQTEEKRIPVYALADDGASVALISLPAGEQAILNADDLQRLRDLGFSDQFQFALNRKKRGRRYVVTQIAGMEGKSIPVAHIIANPGAGEIVTYRDRDTLNLRFDNLEIKPGPSEGRVLVAMFLLNLTGKNKPAVPLEDQAA